MTWHATVRYGALLSMAVSWIQSGEVRRTLAGLRYPNAEIPWQDRFWRGWWRDLDLYPDRAAAREQIRLYWIWKFVFVTGGVILFWSI